MSMSKFWNPYEYVPLHGKRDFKNVKILRTLNGGIILNCLSECNLMSECNLITWVLKMGERFLAVVKEDVTTEESTETTEKLRRHVTLQL